MNIRASDRRKIVLDEKKRCNRDNWDYCFNDRAHLSTFIAKFLFYIYLQTYTYIIYMIISTKNMIFFGFMETTCNDDKVKQSNVTNAEL